MIHNKIEENEFEVCQPKNGKYLLEEDVDYLDFIITHRIYASNYHIALH